MSAAGATHDVDRASGPLAGALRAPTLASLLETFGDPAGWVVSDLSLGGWRTRQCASELSAQLGVDESATPPAEGAGPGPAGTDWLHRYADLVGSGIDREAAGDLTLIAALDAAERIAAAAAECDPPPTIVVLAPLPGATWTRDDRLLVEALAERSAAGEWRFAVAATDRPAGDVAATDRPGDAVAAAADLRPALVPGIVAAAAGRLAGTVAAAGGGLPGIGLRNGGWLIAPETRRPPAAVAALEYDALLAATDPGSPTWAYAQCHCNNLYVEPDGLAGQAWARFAEGGGEIAMRLLERAASCARGPAARAALLAQLQGIRIGLQRYAAAAGAPDPSPAAGPVLGGFLHQMKGWGLALSGRPGERALAPAQLDTARLLLDGRLGEREWLYLLNIAALGEAAAGDAAGALDLELEIERRLARLRPPDRRLEYVNSLNLARLARRRGDHEASRQLYERAFATTDGLRSESDSFYANLCLARVNTSTGDRREALMAWLRCALHWLASRRPQAFSARSVATLLPGPPAEDEPFVAAVERALATHLAAAVAAGAIDLVELARRPPHFTHAADRPSVADLWAAGVDGVGVLLGFERLRETGEPAGRRPTDSRRALAGLTRDVLAALIPAGRVESAGLVVIDDRHGREVPRTAAELVGSCVANDATGIAWGVAALELPAEVRDRLAASARVVLGPGVETVDEVDGGQVVGFRRYRRPTKLDADEAAILRRLGGSPSVGELTASGFDRRLVDRLEDRRIVSIEIEEETCTAAGIRLPTSASS